MPILSIPFPKPTLKKSYGSPSTAEPKIRPFFSVNSNCRENRMFRCWRRLVGNCLREDFSWDHSAREYEEIYHSLIKNP